MWFLKKVKAGALQYIIIVSVIIALLILIFISLIFIQKRLEIKNTFYKEAIANVQSGFNFLAKSDIPYEVKQNEKFSKNLLEKTSLWKRHWGVFDLITIESNVKNEMFHKTALIGGNVSERDALYLKENNKPLTLVGNTKIAGNVSLPKLGAKRGNISGTSYNGNRLIYGNQKRSTSSLPKIKNVDYLKGLLNSNFLNDSIEFFGLEVDLKKIVSFDEKIAIYKSNSSVYLSNINLKGNIIIQSNASIIVTPSAKLEDLILIAPKVEIQNNVEGNFQAIASEKINLGENCKLNYPSALIVVDNDKITPNNQELNGVFIDTNSEIKGVLIYQNESKEKTSNFKQQIVISKNSVITGEIYCSENLELLGSVYGSVITNNFITKQSGSVYINHIYNGVINSNELPKQYCGLFLGNSNQKVAKWLY